MKRSVRLIGTTGLATAAIALLTQCSSPVEGTPATAEPPSPTIDRAAVEPWLGEWTGPIEQAGMQYTVNLSLEHDGDTVTGTTDYPDLDCSGELGDATLADDVLAVVETITVGADACITPVELELTLQPGEVVYRFDDQGGGEGVLRRPTSL